MVDGVNDANKRLRMNVKELYVNGVQVAGTQAANIADLTITATTGTLPTANGALTISNAATPTVTELQEGIVELNAKVSAIIAALEGAGIAASA